MCAADQVYCPGCKAASPPVAHALDDDVVAEACRGGREVSPPLPTRNYPAPSAGWRVRAQELYGQCQERLLQRTLDAMQDAVACPRAG